MKKKIVRGGIEASDVGELRWPLRSELPLMATMPRIGVEF